MLQIGLKVESFKKKNLSSILFTYIYIFKWIKVADGKLQITEH